MVSGLRPAARFVCSLLLPAMLLVAAAPGAAAAEGQGAPSERKLTAVRATAPIHVDGILDEADWRNAPVADHFTQNEPHEGQPATLDTEVRVLYDDQNLYFGVFNHDDAPKQAIVTELKKDFNVIEGDLFGIVLDTFHDKRNGYQFEVNPAGAKWDAQCTNDGREVNASWDGMWYAATSMAENGWYAEFAIPLRTVKFDGADSQTWGVNFLRRVRRRNEDSYWAPIPRIYRIHRVSLAGTLEGLEGLRPGNNLRVKPYALQSGSQAAAGPTIGDTQAGFDVKYGVTSGLTWDFTVNTDFSQVEADEQQINLSRFSLFFPEKRDFFLENSGVFQFGPGSERTPGTLGSTSTGRDNATKDDVLLFFSRRIGLSSDAQAIPILAGTRLTGRSGRTTMGVLNIQQRSEGTSPSTNFTALRLRRDVLGNSDVGVMLLNQHVAGDRDNRVAGLDANFRFFRFLNVNGFAATSATTGVARTDPGTARASVGWRDNFWDLRTSYIAIGKGFTDEMGFVPRIGVNKTDVALGFHYRPRSLAGWLREVYPHWQVINVNRRAGGGLDSRYTDYRLPLFFQDGSTVEYGMNPTIEDITAPFVLNSRRGVSVAPGRYEFNEHYVTFKTNASSPVSLSGRYALGTFYDGYKHSYQAGATLRPNPHLNVTASLTENVIDLPAGRYSTELISTRVNYGFTTTVFLNALVQYNTDARQWTSNVRFNIIHHPLSDFFLVYNERRDTQTQGLIDRALVAKLTYMVAF